VAQPVTEVQERLGSLAERSGLTFAVAESLTGGELSARLAATPGSGGWFRGGLVAYASDVKRSVLGVPPGPVVSEAAATAMAEGVCGLLGADLSVAVTGVAGPDPQDGEPPGTVWFAVRHGNVTTSQLRQFDGDPVDVVDVTCAHALVLLIQRLQESCGDA
jgi:nicotinamide-nucleotide amidase